MKVVAAAVCAIGLGALLSIGAMKSGAPDWVVLVLANGVPVGVVLLLYGIGALR
jgi:hypothetical protein